MRDVAVLSDGGGGNGARGGAEFEVDDAVGVKGIEDRESGVREGRKGGEEAVDIG